MTLRTFKEGDFIPGTSYLVESVLGSGAAGSVYKCFDTELNRLLAVKVLNSWSDDYPNLTAIKRLEREAKILCRLSHNNIVRIYRIGFIDESLPYYSMEYLNGISLREHLQTSGRLQFSEALQIVTQIAEALDFAHTNGVLHRDLKPDNVFLAKTEQQIAQVKIIDFGLSKSDLKSTTLTDPGDIVGTVLYMSPEQCTAKTLDRRADIYALGCILYEMLTGSVPFLANTAMEVLQMHLNAEIPKIESKEKLAISIGSLIEKCLQKNPAERYQTAKELVTELQKLQVEYTGNISHLELQEKTEIQTGDRKHWALATLFLVFSIGLIILSIWQGWQNSPSFRLLSLKAIGPHLDRKSLYEIQMAELPDLSKVSAANRLEYVRTFTNEVLLSKLPWLQQVELLDHYGKICQESDRQLSFKLALEKLELLCDFLIRLNPNCASLNATESKIIDETVDSFYMQKYERKQWRLISAIIEKHPTIFRTGGRAFLWRLAELRADALVNSLADTSNTDSAENVGKHYLYALDSAYLSNPDGARRIEEKTSKLTKTFPFLAKIKFRLSMARSRRFATLKNLTDLRNEFARTKALANDCAVSPGELKWMYYMEPLLTAKDKEAAWRAYREFESTPQEKRF